ncbi:MAG TPA: Bax inhibitor-1/YccA family protein [Prolixibacteraceae bacterium]|nr:Bax inhibitor-1/YccA family protein [Prolixibacteraceae bacterium]
MNLTKSSNPVLNERVFSRESTWSQEVMTINGTVNKTGLMLLLVIAGALFTWNKFFTAFTIDNPQAGMAAVAPWLMIGGIGGLIVALITSFRPQSSAITAPIYAVLEGVLLGGLSAVFESMHAGIVMRAVALTMGVFVAMLVLYRSQVVPITNKFRMGVFAATGGIALVYLGSFIAGLFGANTAFLYDSSPLSIGISLVVIVVAALNLMLDFDFIEKASASGAPKYMEWYGAFGLMVTLVWLYLEMLRLLSKFANRE